MKTKEHDKLLKRLERFNELPDEKKNEETLSEALGFDVLERAREFAKKEVDLFFKANLKIVVENLWEYIDNLDQEFADEHNVTSILNNVFSDVESDILDKAVLWELNNLYDQYDAIMWDVFADECEKGENILKAIHKEFTCWSEIKVELNGFIVYINDNKAIAIPYNSDWMEEHHHYKYTLENELPAYGYNNSEEIAMNCVTILPHHKYNIIDEKTYEFHHYYSVDDAVRFANEIISKIEKQ